MSSLDAETSAKQAAVAALRELIKAKQADANTYRAEITRLLHDSRRQTWRSSRAGVNHDTRSARKEAAQTYAARAKELSATVDQLQREIKELVERLVQLA